MTILRVVSKRIRRWFLSETRMKRPELQIWYLYRNQTFPWPQTRLSFLAKHFEKMCNMEPIEFILPQFIEKQCLIKGQGD